MERHQSFRMGAMEKQQSFQMRVMEKQKSFQMGLMEKRKSFRIGVMVDEQSVCDMKKKDSPEKRGDSPLHLAVRASSLTRVREIHFGLDVCALKELILKQNQDGETALFVAAEIGHVEIVREILRFSDVQSAVLKANNSFDSFHIAAKHGHVDVLKELLHFSPELAMTTNSSNATALDTAATYGHIDVVNLLLETDESLAKIARKNGKTVLHSAARMGHVEVVKALLNKEPAIGLRTDKKGQTALHMAVKGHNVEIVLELLKPDPLIINLQDNKGNSPLHTATRKGRRPILQSLLLIEGISVNAYNKAGETALDIAEKSCNEEIATLLRDAGAVPAKEHESRPAPTKQLNQTVSYIKHEVNTQLRQTRRTEMRVQDLKKKLQKMQVGGLNNAINSNNVVATLIASVAFAAIFQVPGQYTSDDSDGLSLGQAYIANDAAFIIFLVSDSLALFISLAVVVAQTSLIVIDQKAMKLMVFVINKLMWLSCLFISVSFVSLTYVVVGRQEWWLAWSTVVIAAAILFSTLGLMFYWVIMHRMERKNMKNLRRTSGIQSHSWTSSMTESGLLRSEFKKIYAL